MARFILDLVKDIAKACIYLMLEFAVYIAIGGLAIALISLGVPSNVALGVSLVLVVFTLIVSSLAYKRHRITTSRPGRNSYIPVRGEVKFADWIAQTLSARAPQEWEEYQDWLHDILLARRQLLDSGCPVWKVTAIAHWRLMGLCITVGSIKLKRWAIAARRLR